MRVVNMNFQQEYIQHSYCELTIPPARGGNNESTFAMAPNHLHIWPRHRFMLIALPNKVRMRVRSISRRPAYRSPLLSSCHLQNCSFTCTLFMPTEDMEAIRDEGQLMSLFRTFFPDSIPLIGEQNLKQEFFNNPHNPLMTVKVLISAIVSPVRYLGIIRLNALHRNS
jgi:kynurenine 3-monooxygenase